MPLIRTRINYRRFVLGQDVMGTTVGVLTKDGEYRYFPWSGFIEKRDAMKISGAIPVKLFALAYATSDDEWGPWTDLTPDQALQGCWHV